MYAAIIVVIQTLKCSITDNVYSRTLQSIGTDYCNVINQLHLEKLQYDSNDENEEYGDLSHFAYLFSKENPNTIRRFEKKVPGVTNTTLNKKPITIQNSNNIQHSDLLVNLQKKFKEGTGKKKKVMFHDYQLTSSEFHRMDDKIVNSFNDVLAQLKNKCFGTLSGVKTILEHEIQELMIASKRIVDNANLGITLQCSETYDNKKRISEESCIVLKDILLEAIATATYPGLAHGLRHYDRVLEEIIDDLSNDIILVYKDFEISLNEVTNVNIRILNDVIASLKENLANIECNEPVFDSVDFSLLEKYVSFLEDRLLKLTEDASALVKATIDRIVDCLTEDIISKEEIEDIKDLVTISFDRFCRDTTFIFQSDYAMIDKVIKKESVKCFTKIESEIRIRLYETRQKMDKLFSVAKKEQLELVSKTVEKTHEVILANSLSQIYVR